jgi:hypothetical protein
MSNTNSIFGARFISLLNGGDVQVRPYIVDGAGDATAMFVGDFVKLTGEGKLHTNASSCY